MPRVITGAYLAQVGIGINTMFNAGLETVEATWPKVAVEAKSTGREEAYPWLSGIPGMREWIGARSINQLAAAEFAIKNRKFEDSLSISIEDLEDDKLGIYGPAIALLAEAAGDLPDELVWPLLPNGLGTLSWDGQYFFDTDHPVTAKDGSTTSVSNYGGGAGTPWYLLSTKRVRKPLIFQKRTDVQFARKDKPEDNNVFFQDEVVYGVRMRCNSGYGFWQCAYASQQEMTAANFNAAYAAMQQIPGDHGKHIKTTPNLLVVPPNLREQAVKIIHAEQIDGTTNTNRNLVEIHVEERLA
ncbi:MAG: Mu-like prophage major head subunit gpT family protein [Rhodospirillum sp.]|nr:Mu-like prophage major head subunit gpT family protein [Rhodospirillum sp.]MCF8500188.1 Mu-like prophage major head subunit gpT family protein [Rhodospirillum sp.]